jgi:hypothetical protein
LFVNPVAVYDVTPLNVYVSVILFKISTTRNVYVVTGWGGAVNVILNEVEVALTHAKLVGVSGNCVVVPVVVTLPDVPSALLPINPNVYTFPNVKPDIVYPFTFVPPKNVCVTVLPELGVAVMVYNETDCRGGTKDNTATLLLILVTVSTVGASGIFNVRTVVVTILDDPSLLLAYNPSVCIVFSLKSVIAYVDAPLNV